MPKTWVLMVQFFENLKSQEQLREITLQEENAEYDKAISDYENKIQAKSQEADLLRSKLQVRHNSQLSRGDHYIQQQHTQGISTSQVWLSKQHDKVDKETVEVEEEEEQQTKTSNAELEQAQAAAASESAQSNDYLIKNDSEAQEDEESANSALLRKLEEKKKELAQAEGLANDVHLKEMELERLNGLWRKLEASSADANATRNRYARSSTDRGHVSLDYIVDLHQKPGRPEKLHKLMLFKSAFVVYILTLHILVFIKISF
ncbi:hypothetical protein CQW23_10130 [Capsicum baccatum]|uniref:Uncharacterized protein n=1 Tax=Capsicum baccatum TaxID=33114 RepID=A0A2G2WYU3_CAPBA|nr:hypothetical protein CQW23_10130 [Capsicum baccatum]